MCKEKSLNKNCIVVDVGLAMILGLSETIIVEQMNYWLERSTHIIEGRPWIYNTYAAWQTQLPFFCERTIRRIINKLEIMGIILSGNFNKSKMDKTKWYSLNYDILDKLQNEALDRESCKLNPNNKKSYEDTHLNGTDLYCGQTVQIHIDSDKSMGTDLPVDKDASTKAIPEITPETNSKEEVVEARPLGKNSKTMEVDEDETIGITAEDKSKNFSDIINFFSSNIHLPTPHECEKLRLLYEDIKSPDLIIKAMEISVENRARSFRYIESILYNWMDLNLHSLNEVQEYMQNYKEAGKNQRTHLENKGSTPGVSKERKDDNHGEKKCSGTRQYSSYNKKAQGEVQGKYSGLKPEEPKLPEFTEEDFAEFR